MKKLIALLLIPLCTNTFAFKVSSLVDGHYESKEKGCDNKEVINSATGGEKFYLLGKNTRFVYSPTLVKASEKVGKCVVEYKSSVSKFTITDTETNKACDGKKEKKLISSLTVKGDKAFTYMRRDGKKCNYNWSKK